ncbi:MAG: hypothetical protein WA632_03570 [Gallionella sp.]
MLVTACVCFELFAGPVMAGVEATKDSAASDPKSKNQVWLNPGFYSYHFQKDKGLNNRNFGAGVEYRFSHMNSITLGMFGNSDNQTSHYLGWYWLPVDLGCARIGAVFGAIDGYPRMLDGGWFLAAIPTASIEYQNVGLNLLFMPSFQDRLYGALSIQLKFRIY